MPRLVFSLWWLRTVFSETNPEQVEHVVQCCFNQHIFFFWGLWRFTFWLHDLLAACHSAESLAGKCVSIPAWYHRRFLLLMMTGLARCNPRVVYLWRSFSIYWRSYRTSGMYWCPICLYKMLLIVELLVVVVATERIRKQLVIVERVCLMYLLYCFDETRYMQCAVQIWARWPL